MYGRTDRQTSGRSNRRNCLSAIRLKTSTSQPNRPMTKQLPRFPENVYRLLGGDKQESLANAKLRTRQYTRDH